MSNTNNLLLIGLVAALLIGVFALGHSISKTVEVKVPVVSVVEKNVTVDKIVEVDKSSNLLNDAKAELLAEIADNKSLRVFDGERFATSEISISDVNDVSVLTDDSNRRDTKTTVSFEAELKANSADDDKKAVYKDVTVTVVFHSNSNKDTEITII